MHQLISSAVTILFLCASTLGLAQKTYRVADFSKDYYGKVMVMDTAETFSKGWIAIYEKKTNKELIKVTSDELALTLDDGKVKTNVRDIPYGEQSLILYEDYNFDGVQDLAIEDGQNSCYHGPSFQIYLATRNGFVNSPEFTALAQDYCGMFDVDSAGKRLNTMTKSGCCDHFFSEFVIENNKPKEVKATEENSMYFPYTTTTVQEWNGKKMVVTSHEKTIELDDKEVKVVFSFTIAENNKEVVLFTTEARGLSYALMQKSGRVEFNFPTDENADTDSFTYNETAVEYALNFTNKNASYKIYATKDGKQAGILVNVDGKLRELLATSASIKGSLQNVQKEQSANVTKK